MWTLFDKMWTVVTCVPKACIGCRCVTEATKSWFVVSCVTEQAPWGCVIVGGCIAKQSSTRVGVPKHACACRVYILKSILYIIFSLRIVAFLMSCNLNILFKSDTSIHFNFEIVPFLNASVAREIDEFNSMHQWYIRKIIYRSRGKPRYYIVNWVQTSSVVIESLSTKSRCFHKFWLIFLRNL